MIRFELACRLVSRDAFADMDLRVLFTRLLTAGICPLQLQCSEPNKQDTKVVLLGYYNVRSSSTIPVRRRRDRRREKAEPHPWQVTPP